MQARHSARDRECEQRKQRRAERREWCQQNPEQCEQQRAEWKQRRAELKAKCAADPVQCEELKQQMRERRQQRQGDARADAQPAARSERQSIIATASISTSSWGIASAVTTT